MARSWRRCVVLGVALRADLLRLASAAHTTAPDRQTRSCLRSTPRHSRQWCARVRAVTPAGDARMVTYARTRPPAHALLRVAPHVARYGRANPAMRDAAHGSARERRTRADGQRTTR